MLAIQPNLISVCEERKLIWVHWVSLLVEGDVVDDISYCQTRYYAVGRYYHCSGMTSFALSPLFGKMRVSLYKVVRQVQKQEMYSRSWAQPPNTLYVFMYYSEASLIFIAFYLPWRTNRYGFAFVLLMNNIKLTDIGTYTDIKPTRGQCNIWFIWKWVLSSRLRNIKLPDKGWSTFKTNMAVRHVLI